MAQNEANINLINTFPCPITLNTGGSAHDIEPNAAFNFQSIEAGNYYIFDAPGQSLNGTPIELTYSEACDGKFRLDAPIGISAMKSAEELAEQDGTEEYDKGGV